ncbi:MAG: hypothetical protein QOF30_2911 [Acidimicrobiaceae bacterium]|jgi:hypothetical protein|nr:hypothetical protein [Acidimicrobiaceae bacterium]
MDDIQRARYDRVFDAYVNAAGPITRDCFAQLTKALAEIRGQSADSAAVAEFDAELGNSWDRLAARADTDNDGRCLAASSVPPGDDNCGHATGTDMVLAEFDPTVPGDRWTGSLNQAGWLTGSAVPTGAISASTIRWGATTMRRSFGCRSTGADFAGLSTIPSAAPPAAAID